MSNMTTPFKIAAIQAAPVFLNREATVEKACGLIAEAAREGAKLAVFPEGFIPTYPLWVWFIPPKDGRALRELYTEFVNNAVAVPSPTTERLCEAAREARIHLAVGINELNVEASGGTVYNTILYIDDQGRILGKHRKLMPTSAERLVHGMGDGSTMEVFDTPLGKLSGLMCWENYMPLARYAMIARGTQIYVAPTWDRGEPWISTMRHVAKEGRMYVVGCCTPLRKDDIPDRLEFKEKYLTDAPEWLNPGDSLIVDPDGKIVAGPLNGEAGIIYADVDPAMIVGPRSQLDCAGHYGRPDIFDLRVDFSAKPMLNERGESVDQSAPPLTTV